MDIAIHVNPALPHQREHGSWLKSGFKKHGLKVTVTSDRTKEADIHVISGPWYAKQCWLDHPYTILLDRAYYRDDDKPRNMASMPCVSLGWMREDGGRKFRAGSGRVAPDIKNRRTEGGSIFLADYSGPIEPADTIRLHPDRERPGEGLVEVLRRHKLAIGYQTTALVIAALEGLEVVCKDKRNIMAEPNWLQLLPYADWHYKEIESGEAWEHLRQQL